MVKYNFHYCCCAWNFQDVEIWDARSKPRCPEGEGGQSRGNLQIRGVLPLTSLAPPSTVPGAGILFSAVEIYKVSFKNQVTSSRNLSHRVSKGLNEYNPQCESSGKQYIA